MADTKLSSLTAGAAVGATDLFYNVQTGGAGGVKTTGTQLKTFTSASPTLVTPALGVGTATSLALGGATIGSNALAVTGTANFSGSVNASYFAGSYFQTGDGSFFDGTGTFRFAADTYLVRDAANTFAQRNGTTAQTHRVYNTFTDASNGEWGTLNWADTANVLTIGTKKNGTGVARNVQFVVGGVNKLDYGVSSGSGWTLPDDLTVGGSFRLSGTLVNLAASADGKLRLLDSTAANFGMIQFGGITSSFPALKRSTTKLQARLADDSADATLEGIIATSASTTARAGLNLPSGTAPTSPVDGDIWYDGTNLKVRLAGATKTITAV